MWDDWVNKAASHWGREYGITIDPGLVHAILERESRHGQDPNYKRHKGVVPEPGGRYSYGPMMVLGDTVKTLNATLDPRALAQSPALGVWYGTHYLAKQLKRFGPDIDRAIAAYNAGPGNAVRGAGGLFPNQKYVDFVRSVWKTVRTGGAAKLLPFVVVAAAAIFLASRRRRAA